LGPFWPLMTFFPSFLQFPSLPVLDLLSPPTPPTFLVFFLTLCFWRFFLTLFLVPLFFHSPSDLVSFSLPDFFPWLRDSLRFYQEFTFFSDFFPLFDSKFGFLGFQGHGLEIFAPRRFHPETFFFSPQMASTFFSPCVFFRFPRFNSY